VHLTAGVDEAGRGPLAGPVVAAAVILDAGRPIDGLADSKKLSVRRREALAAGIVERALAHAVIEVQARQIDRLDILQATLAGMRAAVAALAVQPLRVLVDGNRDPGIDGIPTCCIVGGDALEPAISAASILAKVHRDRRMLELHEQYPAYGFDRHKGYPTRAHLEALAHHGPTPEHRRSFRPVRDWMDLVAGGRAGSGRESA